jgi:GNAT superfamily N-acetyltransferase
VTDPAGLTESEAALVAAMGAIRWLPGAEVHAGPDVTWVAGGRPLDGVNHVLRLDVSGSDAEIEARIDAIDADLRQRGAVPTTWWIGPSTLPADLAGRLHARGFVDADPEYGMVIDLAEVQRPAAAAAAATSAASTAAIEEVEDEAGLDAFLAVMGGAYGWADDGRSSVWAELYRSAPALPDRPWWHVLVRRDGRPSACASLFTADGHAFVTNVGTIPSARGAGLGTAATLAVLDIARRLGYRRASLTASLMGRGVYTHIGFREDARLDRCISPAAAARA